MHRKGSAILRLAAGLVVFFYAWGFIGLRDLVAYAYLESRKASNHARTNRGHRPVERFQEAIEEMRRALNDSTSDTDAKKRRIRAIRTEINELDSEIREELRETEAKLNEAALPQEIMQRHYTFVSRYEERFKELCAKLDGFDEAKTKSSADVEIERAKTHLETLKPPKRHRPVDRHKLPHRAAEPVFNEPRTTPAEFRRADSQPPLKSPRPAHLGARPDDPLTDFLSHDILSGWGTSEVTTNTVPTRDRPTASPAPPSSADLGETIEVRFTPEIQTKAAELEYNPVKIYNWVRNNIEFVPTYGSIQGADMTLQTKQGNAFDTASLLIALLRASNIPSRYVHGTIEVPIEKVMNWVGGFSDPYAAMNFMASGGIPVTGLAAGGKVVMVRMEHVWVDAWIDYVPSRGSRHRTGEGDIWIPLDASFKQFDYSPGIDLESDVPFDAQAYMDRLKSTAIINEVEGYVANIDANFMQEQMKEYHQRVLRYVSENYPNATRDTILGAKTIIAQSFPYLLGTLPHRNTAKGVCYSSLPEGLRHRLVFQIARSDYTSDLTTIVSLPEIIGRRVTLSYVPATSEDIAVIKSLGDAVSIKTYLVNLKPELKIDG